MAFKISVQSEQLQIPKECVCCGGPDEAEVFCSSSVVKVQLGPNKIITYEWRFPFCRRCQRHTLFMARGAFIRAMTRMTVHLLWIPYLLLFKPLKKWWARRRMLGPGCTSLEPFSYAWSGTTHTFHFASPRYAQIFARANRESLLRPSREVQALLDAPPVDEIQGERPPPRVDPED